MSEQTECGRLSPARALAWSEARLDDATAPVPALAFWLPEGLNVALGLSQRVDEETRVEDLRRDGVGVVRRASGGGAVLLSPGVVCWEAWADLEDMERREKGASGIRGAYRFLCRPVLEGLRSLSLDVFSAGISDICVRWGDGPPRKLAGTAQLRRRQRTLVHGSLLFHPDLALMGKYLREPKAQPEYREKRSHGDFCTSVAACREAADGLRRFVAATARFATGEGWTVVSPPAEPDAAARSLYEEKYARDAWNWEKRLKP